MSRAPQSEEEAQRRFEQAVNFTRDVRGDEAAAHDIEEAGLDAWLESKGWSLENPAARAQASRRSSRSQILEMESKTIQTISQVDTETGEETTIDPANMSKAELQQAVEDLSGELELWRTAGETIGDAIIAFEDGDLDASELADEAWDALCTADPENYEPDDDESGDSQSDNDDQD